MDKGKESVGLLQLLVGVPFLCLLSHYPPLLVFIARAITKTYHSQEQVVHCGTEDVENISGQPDVQKGQRQGLARLALVVFPQLSN